MDLEEDGREKIEMWFLPIVEEASCIPYKSWWRFEVGGARVKFNLVNRPKIIFHYRHEGVIRNRYYSSLGLKTASFGIYIRYWHKVGE